jgi:integrase
MHADRIARALQRINKKMNTAQKGNHGIRRTYLSTLDAFGNLTDEEIRSVAGHKEITTTQNSYLYSVQRPESRVIQFEKALERLG